MGNGPCGEKAGDVGSREKGRRENQVAREQPRKQSRRGCWTCNGVCEWLALGRTREMDEKRVGKAGAGEDAFSGEEGKRGKDSRF